MRERRQRERERESEIGENVWRAKKEGKKGDRERQTDNMLNGKVFLNQVFSTWQEEECNINVSSSDETEIALLMKHRESKRNSWNTRPVDDIHYHLYHCN